MKDQKPTDSNAGAFMGPDMMIPAPIRTMSDEMGPGEPEPEDGWKLPAWPADEVEGEVEPVHEPAHAGHGVGLLHRLTHRG